MERLFLGVGNLHRADDGVGPHIAQLFASDGTLAARGVEVLPHSGEGASLMHLWEGKKKAVIVDCMKTGVSLGTVRRFDATREKLNGGVFRYSSHLFGLAEAVEMARALEKMPDEMIIYGVEGALFEFGAPRSGAVEDAVPQVMAAVLGDFGG